MRAGEGMCYTCAMQTGEHIPRHRLGVLRVLACAVLACAALHGATPTDELMETWLRQDGGPSLDDIVPFKGTADLVENMLFVRAPRGFDQQSLRAVARDAVNDGFRRQQPQSLYQKVGVLGKSHHRPGIGRELLGHARAAQNLEQLKLHAVRRRGE